jgi:hypothetical protein
MEFAHARLSQVRRFPNWVIGDSQTELRKLSTGSQSVGAPLAGKYGEEN